MAYDFNGTNQYLRLGTAAVTTTPITMACFVRIDSTFAQRRVMGLFYEAGTTTSGWSLDVAGATGLVQALTADSGSFATANSGAAVSTSGSWNHACVVFASASDRKAYIDGGSSGSNTTTKAPTSAPTNTCIGAMVRSGGTAFTFVDGAIAEPAIWNAALTDAEIASLAKGVSPALIRPESLVFYPPLVRDLTELVGGTSLTAYNSPTIATHPRVYGL